MATSARGPLWLDHEQDGKTYALGHLHPIVLDHSIPAQSATNKKPGRAAVQAKLYVHYSHHCFTQAVDRAPDHDPEHRYTCLVRDETRVFCPLRWQESSALPSIVATLHVGKCFHTRHHNYFVVRDPTGKTDDDYFVYFAVKLGTSGAVELHVESAYLRSDKERQTKNTPKVGFNVLVVNALRGVRTSAPPK